MLSSLSAWPALAWQPLPAWIRLLPFGFRFQDNRVTRPNHVLVSYLHLGIRYSVPLITSLLPPRRRGVEASLTLSEVILRLTSLCLHPV